MTESQVAPPAGRRRSADIALAAAGVLTTCMALYHFWLPFAFRWGDALVQAPALRWGLFMLNASFSYLLLAGGVATIALALGAGSRQGAGRWVLVAMFGYWLFNASYQLVNPLPLPPGFALLGWCFFGFAAAVALLYAGALVRGPRSAATPSTSVRPAALAG